MSMLIITDGESADDVQVFVEPLTQTVTQERIEEAVIDAQMPPQDLFEIPIAVATISQDGLDRAGLDNAEKLSSTAGALRAHMALLVMSYAHFLRPFPGPDNNDIVVSAFSKIS